LKQLKKKGKNPKSEAEWSESRNSWSNTQKASRVFQQIEIPLKFPNPLSGRNFIAVKVGLLFS
jgi:hypothetical protein